MSTRPARPHRPPARLARLPLVVLAAVLGVALLGTLALGSRPAGAAACPVTLTAPGDGTVAYGNPTFKWAASCASYRVWFSPSGTFGADLVRSTWRTQKRFQFTAGDWDTYQVEWEEGFYWKVQGKAADGTLTFSATRHVDMAPVTRFAALGDTGKGNADQQLVADAMKSVCDTEGCDFVLLLGDNIYPTGPTSADPSVDPQWDTLFEVPYAAFAIPFYPVMGNHDYGDPGGAGWPPAIDLSQGQMEVDHTLYSALWTMPDEYYSFPAGDVDFFALDTSRPLLGAGALADLEAEMDPLIAGSSALWKIAFGHYPYYSNGTHGDAGNYDGVPGRGAEIQTLLDDLVCGRVDLYIAAHDHNRQWLADTCLGTELVVSGGGSESRNLPGTHPAVFQSVDVGFFWFRVQDEDLTIAAYDSAGVLEYQDTRSH